MIENTKTYAVKTGQSERAMQVNERAAQRRLPLVTLGQVLLLLRHQRFHADNKILLLQVASRSNSAAAAGTMTTEGFVEKPLAEIHMPIPCGS